MCAGLLNTDSSRKFWQGRSDVCECEVEAAVVFLNSKRKIEYKSLYFRPGMLGRA